MDCFFSVTCFHDIIPSFTTQRLEMESRGNKTVKCNYPQHTINVVMKKLLHVKQESLENTATNETEGSL